MRIARWGVTAALAGTLALAGCGGSDREGGDTRIEDQEEGVPVGAIPAPSEGSPANPAAAGAPLDSSAVPADTAQPMLGK